MFLRSAFGRLILLALAAWGTLSLWNWVTTESVEEQQAGDTSAPYEVKGLKSFLVRQDNGQKYWEIAADSAQNVENGNAWLARNVTKGVLFRDDKPWITMRAPRVRFSNLSRNLDAVGGVTASGPENFSFSTPQARWLDKKKQVEIPGAVRARLREMEFAAPNLSYQWEKGELKSPGPVEVRVKGGVLRGSQMTTYINKRQVDFGRAVELIFVPGVFQLPRPFAPATPAVAPAATPSAAPDSAAKPAVFAPNSSAALERAPTNFMFRSRHLPIALTLAAATAPAALLVQTPVAPLVKTALAAPSSATPGNVVIDASNSSYTDANGVSVLGGGVTIKEVGKDFSLSASDVIYSQPKSQASAKGNLKVTTHNSTIRGAELFGDFNKKLLSISGNVVISAYDKGDGMSGFRSSVARKPMRIACNRLDWNYVTQQATLIGNIRIVQADNSGTCDSIVYDETKNIVYLRGNVRFGNSKRQQFVGNEVTVFVDKGLVSAPNITIRSGVDAAGQTPTTATPKTAAPIVIPGQNAVNTGNITLPKAPPPIESLVPKSTPLVREKPTLPPLPENVEKKVAESKTKSNAKDAE